MDLRVLKTQQAINTSFLSLFDTNEFDKITVKDITTEAQVGRKTFYLHYLDKYDLLDNIVDKKMEALHEICEAKRELGLREGTTIWFNYFEENRQFFTKLFNISIAHKYKHQLQKLIIDELSTKLKPNHPDLGEIDQQLFLKFVSSGIIELIDVFLQDSSYSKEAIEEQTYRLINSFVTV